MPTGSADRTAAARAAFMATLPEPGPARSAYFADMARRRWANRVPQRPPARRRRRDRLYVGAHHWRMAAEAPDFETRAKVATECAVLFGDDRHPNDELWRAGL